MGVKKFILIVIFLVLPNLSFGDEARNRDGNWWLNESRNDKLVYVIGFFDGMQLGKNFTVWKLIPSKSDGKKLDNKCLGLSNNSFDEYNEKYLSNVSNIQITDGLDVFYADYRNRGISLPNAIWLVVRQIKGEPIDENIDNWRRNAH